MVESYKYLGLILTDFLDFSKAAKAVAKSANRALGLIIAKAKSFGGVHYNVFYKLYESIVCPVIMYGAPIWGQNVLAVFGSCKIEQLGIFEMLVNTCTLQLQL